MLSPPEADTAERQAHFEAVYAANHAPILGYALRRTASPDDAAHCHHDPARHFRNVGRAVLLSPSATAEPAR